jgi:hypothetical protein
MGMALVLGVSGLVFGLYAEFAWLDARFATDVAALGVSFSACALALICAGAGKILSRDKRQSLPAEPPADITKIVSQLMDSIGQELEEPIRENPKTAVMLASIAGFAIGGQRP